MYKRQKVDPADVAGLSDDAAYALMKQAYGEDEFRICLLYTSTPLMVVPPGEHTASFIAPGCVPVSR